MELGNAEILGYPKHRERVPGPRCHVRERNAAHRQLLSQVALELYERLADARGESGAASEGRLQTDRVDI